MRWEDERYVRVYTRDTVDWQSLSFDAQALFLLLLRKVDRAGLLDLGKPGKRGVAVAVGHPREWPRLEPALEDLLTDGCVRLVEDGRRLLVPNFMAAQESKSSDRARQQKSRETARDVAALQSVTSSDATSHGVTDRHTETHDVTSGHDTSHGVTPSRAVLSHAEPSSLSAGADEPEDLPDTTDDAHPVVQPPLFAVVSEPEKPKERPEDLQALWNSEAHPNLPRWKELTDKRRRQATTRLRERPLSEWQDVIRRINASAFLRGEQGSWRASPDWLLQPDAAVKVLEGKYAPSEGTASPTPKPTKFVEM